MPPSRRQSRATTPPSRRPRVAGLRRPAGVAAGPDQAQVEAEPTAAEVDAPEVATPEYTAAEAETAGDPAREDPALAGGPELETEPDTGVWPSVIGAPESETEVRSPAEDETVAETPRPVRARPAGKRRSLGIAQPDDLAAAEAGVTTRTERVRVHRDNSLVWAIGLAVTALLLAALAVWFRGEANSTAEGADTNNRALTDPGAQSEVVRQVREAIEKTLTYNYTDLDSTAKAVQDKLSGKALCEYDQLFGEVKKLAPEQKIVLTTQVREIGVTRLEGDQATLLVFVDQNTTRADQNQTTASGAQFAVKAAHRDNAWKITDFDMLGQPLPNGKPAPQC